ncbi:hypothetical protein EGH24_07085 [Halonotius terrestris]|uniref:Gamma-glutamyl:cysteine ligase YbdK, ATP-grasp superfamily n=1 Tax=Halonotius terrestris TaxID=2487750 RepID=A0A8J8P8F5_9EURY|nr:hypothetical protein [Halonotius terrestris]TQQ80914.1 hypothetical protein EGH24_07085 [Halonotius terrestris]
MDDVRRFVRRALSTDTREEFDRRVTEQATALRAAISEGAYDSSGFAVGLECECYGVDGEDRLRRLPDALFEGTGRTREIGRHNVELNSTPQPFDADGTTAHATELRTALADLREDAAACDADCRIVTDGMWTIPPAEGSHAYLGEIERDEEIVVAENMHRKPRYCAIDNALLEHAGGSIPLSVPGAEESFPTILVESLTTSIQPHLQIPDTEAFPQYFNAAIRTMGPVLALATNSPFLPSDLYTEIDDPERLVAETPHELRVPIFEATVNSAGDMKAGCPGDIDDPTDIVDRVVDDWTCGPFLSEWEVDADEEPDPYWEFRHKYGTYWRWVRSIIGGDASAGGAAGEPAADTASDGALRIEYRPLPTQPTVDDILALHWLVVGLLRGIVAADHPLTELAWSDARDSFYNAVDDGLDAELHWMTADGEPTTDHDVIYEEVFALAERGLREQGHSDETAADRIGPIRARWEQETTPSQWKKARVREGLADGESLAGAIEAMQRKYNKRSRQGEPFAAW